MTSPARQRIHDTLHGGTCGHPDVALLAIRIRARLGQNQLASLVRLGRSVGEHAHSMELEEKSLIR